MEIRPIFASLRKHRIPALLIVLEIALACAVAPAPQLKAA